MIHPSIRMEWYMWIQELSSPRVPDRSEGLGAGLLERHLNYNRAMRSTLPARRSAGFTLIESLVALVLIGVILLLTMALMAQEPQIQRRLDAHVEVLDILDGAHESLRAGRPIRQGRHPFEWKAFQPSGGLRSAQNLEMWIEAFPYGTVNGLFEVHLRARYFVGQESFDREVTTIAWRR